MTNNKKRPYLNPAHPLCTNRMTNWLRLLHENGWHIAPDRRVQFLYVFLLSLVLSPLTLLERLLFAIPIRRHQLKEDPVFILGHWRSGTTYLQNIITRDPQFAWCDPVSTTTFNHSYLLGRLTGRLQEKLLVGARPMDNMRYGLDLPMEDVFALTLLSTQSIIHMLSFPRNYAHYMQKAFVGELPRREQEAWARATRYVLQKISLRKKGQRLLLKSPDHTCHVAQLQALYPDAKYINIHREPYVAVMSTIHMFKKQTERMRLTELPDDLDTLLETVVVELFERTYRHYFAQLDSGTFRPGQLVEIEYEALVADPESSLRHIYDALGLDGFDAALPHFRAHIEGQREYVKNSFSIQPRLRTRINDHLGFYFRRYGYPMDVSEA